LIKIKEFAAFNRISIERAISEVKNLMDVNDIYKRYGHMVYRIALMMLKYRSDAEDVTQNVFIKLLENGKTFESDEHLKAWLIVTAKNTCKDILKSKWYSKRTNYDEVTEQPYIPDQTAKEFWDVIVTLDDKYKLPLYLYYYEGYKTGEIAEILKTKQATVWTHMRLAKQKLKEQLEKEGAKYD